MLVWAKALDEWYGTRGTGFALVRRLATVGPDQRVWLLAMLATEDGLRRYFDDMVEARVRTCPEIDGVETWQLEGALDAEGIARLVDRPDEDLEALELVARASRLPTNRLRASSRSTRSSCASSPVWTSAGPPRLGSGGNAFCR